MFALALVSAEPDVVRPALRTNAVEDCRCPESQAFTGKSRCLRSVVECRSSGALAIVGGSCCQSVPTSVSHRAIPGAPHGLNWTHAEQLNRELLEFLGN